MMDRFVDRVGVGILELLFGQRKSPCGCTEKSIKPPVGFQGINQDPVAVINDAADFRAILRHGLAIIFRLPFFFHSAAGRIVPIHKQIIKRTPMGKPDLKAGKGMKMFFSIPGVPGRIRPMPLKDQALPRVSWE
jgi:hypothetical protein